MQPYQLNYGRALMGDSLGFHILFALFGVGIPLLMCLFELAAILRKDSAYYTMVKRWSFVQATLFVVGAVSGIIISNQFVVLWPTFMALAGRVIGLPFFMESFAFFVEAIFLGIYLYSWDRLTRWQHWLTSLPVVLASAASAFFITSANAWMNSPAGFTYESGAAGNINPIAAMFNHATLTETTHSIFAYYLTTALVFCGAYAVFLLREKTGSEALRAYYRKAIVALAAIGFVFALGVASTGDKSGTYVAQYEPIKFAAMENVAQSTAGASLDLYGVHFPQPHGLLSYLANRDGSSVVLGLGAFSPALWPPLWIHGLFDTMVLIGIAITILPGMFLLLSSSARTRKFAYSRTALWLLVACGILAVAGVELGWMVTEIGRQPYAIKGIMTTAQAFTTSGHVIEFGYIFPSLYVVLFIATPWVLVRHFKKNKLNLDAAYFEAENQRVKP